MDDFEDDFDDDDNDDEQEEPEQEIRPADRVRVKIAEAQELHGHLYEIYDRGLREILPSGLDKDDTLGAEIQVTLANTIMDMGIYVDRLHELYVKHLGAEIASKDERIKDLEKELTELKNAAAAKAAEKS